MLIDMLRALQKNQEKYLSLGKSIPKSCALRKSDISYEIIINFVTLKDIAEFAKEMGLIKIEEEGKHNFHYLTEKGLRTIKSFNEWDVNHDLTPLSIYVLTKNPNGSISLYRDKERIRKRLR